MLRHSLSKSLFNILIIKNFGNFYKMSLLSRLSLKEFNIKVYGTKTVILARIEKNFVDAE